MEVGEVVSQGQLWDGLDVVLNTPIKPAAQQRKMTGTHGATALLSGCVSGWYLATGQRSLLLQALMLEEL